jgi:rod shape-determining protein MreD
VIPFTPHLIARLVALGVAMVILQVAAVSQIELFGTNADLSPVVIAAVGLMVGSVPGAVFGFAAGLFLDLALVQTLGLSSLVYLAIGYWAGRMLELRDPQGALVPFGAGAAATAVATVGYSLMEFLLGVDAPVSFLLVREIVATILLNALISGVVFAVVRRWLASALPEDPRRRRRRAYTTGGLSPLSRART